MVKIAFADLLPGETPVDISELLVSGISTRADLNRVEGENIRKALVKYFGSDHLMEIAPFDFAWVQGLHREMFGDVWGWAGRFRTEDYNLGKPWRHIQESLYNLIQDLHYWRSSGIDNVEQASRLHHGAVLIHPFPNGNGRWARILANIWLTAHSDQWVNWPEHLIGNVSPVRGEYLGSLKAADAGNFDPLIAMHRRYLIQDEP